METDRSPDVTAADIDWTGRPTWPERLRVLADLPSADAATLREALHVALALLHSGQDALQVLDRQVRYWKGRAGQ